MKSLFTTFILICSFLPTLLFSAPPTTPTSNILFFFQDGASMRVQWSSGDGFRRIVVARLATTPEVEPTDGTDYTASAIFGVGNETGPGNFVLYDNSGTLVDISGLAPSTEYTFTVYEYSGTDANTEYLIPGTSANESTVSAPTLQASGISSTAVLGNSINIGWTNGNGNRRLIIAREGAPVAINPVDLISYPPNASFGSGLDLGNNTYVVGRTTLNNLTITNLEPFTVYHFAIFEFNGNSSPVYLIPGATFNQTTAGAPTIGASNALFPFVDGATKRIQWTPGNGSRRVLIIKANSPVDAFPVDGNEYQASSVFGSGDELGTGNYVLSKNFNNLVDISNLQGNTEYHFAIIDYNGTNTNTFYANNLALLDSSFTAQTPTVQVSNLVVSGLLGNQMTLNWTNGNGNARLVTMRAESPIVDHPQDLSFYNANFNFGNGSNLGNQTYAVFRGTQSTTTIANLQPNTTYFINIYEYNGSSSPVYLTPAFSSSQATAGAPTQAAMNMNFNFIQGATMRVQWTIGNGARRILLAKEGAPVDATPQDGTDYVGSVNFGVGDEIGTGNFVLYDNFGSFADINSLQGNTEYHFALFEYNGSGTNTLYQTSQFLSDSSFTALTPTTQTSNIVVSNVTGNQMNIAWTNGDGERRMVFVKEGSPSTIDPVDLQFYNANPFFGSGTNLGDDSYPVYASFGSNVTVNSLQPNQQYFISIYEYNGTNSPVYLTPAATASQTTAGAPTIPATNLSYSFIDGSTMRLTWTNGNGSRRIIVTNNQGQVNALPIDGVDYINNPAFGVGDDLGGGNFVVFDGTGSFVDLNSLQGNTEYHFGIFEYNGQGTNTVYLTNPFLSGSSFTSVTPTTPSSNIAFSNVTSSNMNISWTNGDGNKRIIIAREGQPITFTPTDLISYPASSNFGNNVDLGGGQFCVYNSSSTNFTLNNLQQDSIYYISIFEANGNSSPVYLPIGTTADRALISDPSIQASNLQVTPTNSALASLDWTNGNGNGRILLAKQNAPVDVAPVDGTLYIQNSAFGSGDELGIGNFVVYTGNGIMGQVDNLSSDSTYYFALYEYNILGNTSSYLELIPTITNITMPTLSVCYADGDGDGFGNSEVIQNFLGNCGAGFVLDSTDCNDQDSLIYPGASELCDGLDNNCDGILPADELDADGDGALNCNDGCPNDSLKIDPGICGCGNPEPGTACDDGNTFTINDTIDISCNCVGTVIQCIDSTDCDDNDPCSIDQCDGNGNCVYTPVPDSDGDGACDAIDNCPNDSLKIDPGNCGCGNPEPGTACDDGNIFTVNDTIDISCNCVGTVIQCIDSSDCDDNDPCTVDQCDANGNCVYTPVPDSDGDGACDAIDNCPNDSLKIDPGICGCGNPEPGTVCDDGNIFTVNDTIDISCNCVGTVIQCIDSSDCDDNDPCTIDQCDGNGNCVYTPVPDSDGDGACDAIDNCPNDSLRIDPGTCGCGNPEPGTACDDGDENTIDDTIDNNCNCIGQGAGTPPEAVCSNGYVYLNLFDPDYKGPGFNWVYNISAEQFDAGSSYSSNSGELEIRRLQNFISFDWTTQGACIDNNPNGTVNNKDKGKAWRSCYPASFFDIWKKRKYRLRVSDEFGIDYCTGKVFILMNVGTNANVVTNSIHLKPNISDATLTHSKQELDNRIIEKQLTMDIQLFPNPTNHLLNIQWNSSKVSPITIHILDVLGKSIHRQEYESGIGENKVLLDISHLSEGMYTMTFEMNNLKLAKKWIKN